MVRGLALAGQAQHLRAEFPQVPLHLLLLRALDVVLGGVLQVSLDLSVRHRKQRRAETFIRLKRLKINLKLFRAKYGVIKIAGFKAFNL